MKAISFVILSIFIFQSNTSYSEESTNWGFLLSWINEYPVKENGDDLLKLPKVKNQLNKLISPSDRKLLADYKVSLPTKLEDDFIIVQKCRPHNCPWERALLVLSVKDERFWVGIFERKKDSVSSRWTGSTDDYTTLPEKIRLQLPK